jgi:hypothetical protein
VPFFTKISLSNTLNVPLVIYESTQLSVMTTTRDVDQTDCDACVLKLICANVCHDVCAEICARQFLSFYIKCGRIMLYHCCLSVLLTLSSQLLLNPLGDYDETWYKERSYCVDVHVLKRALPTPSRHLIVGSLCCPTLDFVFAF